MDCESYRSEIEEMEAGERPSGETAAHLSACEPCRAFYEERQSLKRLMGEMQPVAAPADFDFRLRARLVASNGAGNHRSSWRSFVFSAPAIGLAASLVLLGVAATAFYNRTKPVPVTAGRAGEAVYQKGEQPTAAKRVVSPTVDASPQAAPVVATKKNDGETLAATPTTTRTPRMQNGKISPLRKQATAPSNSGQRLSNDYAITRAPVITPYAGASLPVMGASPLVEVSVRSKEKPLKISLDDRSGGKRTVTLEPVVFGSQDLAGRETSRGANPNGIW